MFQFPSFAFIFYEFKDKYQNFILVGFPIQKSLDHSLLGSSPMLIAANHVFHRFRIPRHPPYALSNLIYIKTFALILITNCLISHSIFKEQIKKLYRFSFNIINELVVEVNGIEPMASCVQSRRSAI